MKPINPLRNLVVVLGDQLDLDAAAFDGFDPNLDAVWMAEVAEESTHVGSSKQRIVMFLSAMRHFAQALEGMGRPLHYHRMNASAQPSEKSTLALQLQADLDQLTPQKVVMTAPGEHRLWQAIQAVVHGSGCGLEVREDRHFFTTVADFSAHAKGRKALRLEYFYRELRQRFDILMDQGKPAGGQWNFDADNRESFGPQGPGAVSLQRSCLGAWQGPSGGAGLQGSPGRGQGCCGCRRRRPRQLLCAAGARPPAGQPPQGHPALLA